jgi:hypothetical protein
MGMEPDLDTDPEKYDDARHVQSCMADAKGNWLASLSFL